MHANTQQHNAFGISPHPDPNNANSALSIFAPPSPSGDAVVSTSFATPIPQLHLSQPIMFAEELASLRRQGVRSILFQILNFVSVVSTALAMWKGLSVLTDTESPVVVVLSGSMEPAFYRGDLLFLTMPSGPLKVGDIPVYKVPGADIPIVHRIIETHNAEDGEQLILTKVPFRRKITHRSHSHAAASMTKKRVCFDKDKINSQRHGCDRERRKRFGIQTDIHEQESFFRYDQ
ncbi:hypothetical protein PHSY_000876 [Pseudozyma hubeiensis SY62]|uniref:Signal peptidase complex catalytic subunit SEC11 n=1 Tax=Pseudozyma hubeiensis (strain SY62) TaxID=1305764 RepID=R9NXJ6_PSEHS|nr:hypothetical protein PHSY_000876 [Pseudozyma hubeiensis SY62]GAC93311.1 hypothetical protein PHSY_000876 [Pseudozyma hubeiensis SY62]